jgi:5'-3' exonuclease
VTKSVHNFVGLRPIADEVSKADEGIGSYPVDVGQHSFNCGKVGMRVGKESNQHSRNIAPRAFQAPRDRCPEAWNASECRATSKDETGSFRQMSKQGLTMLVDASSLIYRAFFAIPDTLSAPDGTKVNAAYGFIEMLARLVADYDPQWLACAIDEDWRPQWRVDLIDSYKTHRLAENLGDSPAAAADIEIEDQMPMILEMLSMTGVAGIGVPGYEAEDVAGTLALRAPGEVAIVSGDRDLFQLVRDPKIRVLYPKRGVSDLVVVDESEIRRRFGIPGRAYGDFAILRGDASDGLPGVRGIGEKTAAALVSKYGSLEAVIEAALTKPVGALGKVASSIDYLDRAARVVLITGDAPVPEVDLTRPRGDPVPGFEEVAERFGLLGPVKRLVSALRGESTANREDSGPRSRSA